MAVLMVELMNTEAWLKICEDARQAIKDAASMMLDDQCFEFLGIVDALFKLSEEADEKHYGAVDCGLYAAGYRLAGTGKIIAAATEKAASAVAELGSAGAGDSPMPIAWQNKQKVQNHKAVVRDFAEALKNDCSSDLMHLTSELEVILEHPFVVADEAFSACLRAMHDTLEEHVEWLYDIGAQLNEHPVLGIAD